MNPLRPILAIAFNTYREAVRSKILYSILFFGVFLITFSAVLGELSLYQNNRVIKDIGLFALSLFGNLMAIFLGSSFLHKEIERRSIYNIASKPIHRWHYFVGKFVGVWVTLMVQLSFMFAVFTAVVAVYLGSISASLFVAFVLICVEVTVMASVALFFSSFSTPYLSGFFALGILVAGKSAEVLERLVTGAEPGLRALVHLTERVLPSLYIFNVTEYVTYDLPIPPSFVYHAAMYGLCYAAIALMIGSVAFSRRDFA